MQPPRSLSACGNGATERVIGTGICIGTVSYTHLDVYKRQARDRSVMPQGQWLRHIGIYGYRVSALRAFAALPAGVLERTESLEQLLSLIHI